MIHNYVYNGLSDIICVLMTFRHCDDIWHLIVFRFCAFTSHLDFFGVCIATVYLLYVLINPFIDAWMHACVCNCVFHAIGMRMRIHIECVFIYMCKVCLYSCIFCTKCIVFYTWRNSDFKYPVAKQSCWYLFVNRIPHADTEERIRSNTHSVGSLVRSFEVIPEWPF